MLIIQLLVCSRDWRSSVPEAIPFVTKASRMLTDTATFFRQGLLNKNIEVKGKGHPITGHQEPRGGVEV
jgi:hypothetical protein